MLLFAGCETNGTSKRIIERINEKPSVFAALAPDQKAYVRDGIVFPGDSLETAYIALGIPDTVETRQKEDITVVMWTYSKYYPSGELADFLTAYSRSKNPNLGRFLNIESGSGTISDHVPGADNHPIRKRRGQAHGSETGTYSGIDPGVSIPDIPVYNLYVFIYRGKISDVMIESLDGTVFMWLEEAIEMEEANKLREPQSG